MRQLLPPPELDLRRAGPFVAPPRVIPSPSISPRLVTDAPQNDLGPSGLCSVFELPHANDSDAERRGRDVRMLRRRRRVAGET
jgi:hypothetical protein